MKHLRSRIGAVLLASAVATACDDAGPTAPALDTPDLADELTLQVLSDPGALYAALDLAGVSFSNDARGMSRMPGHRGGMTPDPDLERARGHFDRALVSLAGGDTVGALRAAREGRDIVGRILADGMGMHGLQGLLEHTDYLAMSFAAEGDPLGLAPLMERAAAQGHAALGRGDGPGAGAWAALGEQMARRGHGRHGPVRPHAPDPERAALAVSLAETAVSLAGSILDDQGMDDEQARLLAEAGNFSTEAGTALDEEEYRRAVHLAGVAAWTALKAVIAPGGVDDDEVRMMLDLATARYEAARARLSTGPVSQLQAELLERAGHLLEVGTEHVTNGTVRGVGALWHSAVISTWLIG